MSAEWNMSEQPYEAAEIDVKMGSLWIFCGLMQQIALAALKPVSVCWNGLAARRGDARVWLLFGTRTRRTDGMMDARYLARR